jgi:hypothetical protein
MYTPAVATHKDKTLFRKNKKRVMFLHTTPHNPKVLGS